MSIEKKIRQLARSNYWQNIYSASQKCSGINIFENNTNFSGLQSSFLYWLSTYSMLFEELGKHENDKILTENVIDDDDRCDAYLYLRSKKIDYDWKKHQQTRIQEEVASRGKRRSSPGKEAFIDVDLRSE